MENKVNEYLSTLSKSTTIYGIGAIIVNLLGLALIPILTNYFSPTQFGNIELIFILVNFLISIMGFGMEQTQSYYYYNNKLNCSKNELISNILNFKLIWSFIIFFIFLFFSSIISIFIFNQQEDLKIFITVFFISFFMSFSYQLLLIYRLDFKPVRYVLYTIIEALIRLITILIVLLYFQKSIQEYFYSFLFSYLILFLILLFEFRNFIKINFQYHIIKKIIKYAMPLLPLTFLWFLISITDRIYINNFLNLAVLGLYSIAAKFVLGINFLIDIFHKSWWPIIMKSINDDFLLYNSLFNKVLQYYFCISILILSVLNLTSETIFYIFTGKEYHNAFELFNILILQPFLFGLFYITSIGMWKDNKNIFILYSVIVIASINFILNYYLVPIFGAKGAAYSTVISFLILNFISLTLSSIILKIRINKYFLFLILPLGLIIIYLLYAIEIKNLIMFFIIILNLFLIYFGLKDYLSNNKFIKLVFYGK